jgi:hypothetical protein
MAEHRVVTEWHREVLQRNGTDVFSHGKAKYDRAMAKKRYERPWLS